MTAGAQGMSTSGLVMSMPTTMVHTKSKAEKMPSVAKSRARSLPFDAASFRAETVASDMISPFAQGSAPDAARPAGPPGQQKPQAPFSAKAHQAGAPLFCRAPFHHSARGRSNPFGTNDDPNGKS